MILPLARRGRPALLLALLALPAGGQALSPESKGLAFARQQFVRVRGEVRNFLAGDVDGDGRLDLVVSSTDLSGSAPTRLLSVFLQEKPGVLGDTPDGAAVVPEAVVWTLGRLDPGAPASVVYIAGDGVYRMDWRKGGWTPPVRFIAAAGLFTRPEWNGIRQWDFLRDLDGDGVAEVLLPERDVLAVWGRSAEGRWVERARLALPPETIVFTPQEGYFLINRIESFSVELQSAVPALYFADFDGDGRTDVIAAWEDEVRVFRQEGGGRFASTPQVFKLGVYSWDDLQFQGRLPKARRIFVGDVDGDGRPDVVVGVTNLKGLTVDNAVYVFLNRGGKFSPRPDQVVQTDGFAEPQPLADLNGDGRQDLHVAYISFGLQTAVNYLLFRRAPVHYDFYLAGPEGLPKKPSFRATLSYAADFTKPDSATGQAHVFADLDGDGRVDMAVTRSGKELSVFLGRGGEEVFSRAPDLTVEATVSYFLTAVDLEGNGRADLLFRYENMKDLNSAVGILWSRPAKATDKTRTVF